MRSIQTTLSFPLAEVKPIEGLLRYRAHCLEAMREALRDGARRRESSPVGGRPLEPIGTVEGLPYGRCPATGSLFLTELPEPASWRNLLAEVSRYRHSPDALQPALAHSRNIHVYAPKLEWIQDTLRFHRLQRPSLLEVTTVPSDFTALLEASGTFAEVTTVDEMTLREGRAGPGGTPRAQVAVLLETLDRVDDPVALLGAAAGRLEPGGLMFVTALVASGFDLAVLGLRNLYLCPPDRANCFSLQGLTALLTQEGFTLVEVSTPGVLDVEIVRRHLEHDPSIALSRFERQLIEADAETHEAFQAFLQSRGLSSFARVVARGPA